MRTLAVVLLTSLVVTRISAQADDEFSRATLAGLSGVQVVVENLNPDVRNDGLDVSDVRTDTELKLREASIPVLTREQSSATPGRPYLYMVVSIMKRSDGLCAYNVDVQLVQMVVLTRDRSTTTMAITWAATGSIGTIGENHLRDLRGTIGDFVNQFINAYLAANPKH